MRKIPYGLLAMGLFLLGQLSVALAQEPLTLSYSAVSPTNAGVWMAEERGAFRKNGFDIRLVYIPSASTNIQALLGGSVTVSHAGSSAVILAANQGAPVVAIAVLKKYLRRQDERLLENIYDQLRNYTERIPRVDPKIVDSILSVTGEKKTIRAEGVIDNALIDELVAEGFYTKLYSKEVR